MFVFLGYILLIGFLKLTMSSKKKYNKPFAVIAVFFLFLLGALRSKDFLSDTNGYVTAYLNMPFESLTELWQNTIQNKDSDPFFYLFSKIISMLDINYQGYLAIIVGIFCFAVAVLIYRYSDEAYLSITALVSLGYFTFSLTGLRQAVAIAFALLSYKYLRERKLIPFIILVLLASLFHSSALIFLIAYPLANIRIGWKQMGGFSVSIIIAYLFSNFFRFLVGTFGWTDKISEYAKATDVNNTSALIIQLLVLLFCLYYKKGVLKADEANRTLYNMLFLGLYFQAFAVIIAEMFRVSMYFSIFSIVLVPKAISSEKDRSTKIIVYIAVLFAFFAYFIQSQGMSGFRFYWQE